VGKREVGFVQVARCLTITTLFFKTHHGATEIAVYEVRRLKPATTVICDINNSI
jgi:hypothetical protein